MAPSERSSGPRWPQGPHAQWAEQPINSSRLPANVAYIDNLKLDPNLQPKKYEISGTPQGSKILFLNVKILDSTGREPYKGDVLIQGLTSSLSALDLFG